MDKTEIALKLTLKVLDNFSYNFENYGGNSIPEQAKINSDIASTIFNNIYKNLEIS